MIDSSIEIWKDIPGYEGLYQISNFGQVKSLKRLVSNGNGIRSIEEKKLKQRKWEGHYFQVKLSKNGKVKTHYVHKLVATAFLDNPNNYQIINHIDGNGFNNNIENLEWCTQKYNVNHAWQNKLCESVRESAKHSKGVPPKKVIQLDSNNNIINVYSSVTEAKKLLNITEAQVRGSIKKKKKKFNLRWECNYDI